MKPEKGKEEHLRVGRAVLDVATERAPHPPEQRC